MIKESIFFSTAVLICLFTVCLILPIDAKSQGLSVEIVPSSGAPETLLKIGGKGFAAGEEIEILFILEEDVKIGLGTEKVDVVVADASGVFIANSAVPRMATPGQYKIEVIGNKGNETVITFEVTPKK